MAGVATAAASIKLYVKRNSTPRCVVNRGLVDVADVSQPAQPHSVVTERAYRIATTSGMAGTAAVHTSASTNPKPAPIAAAFPAAAIPAPTLRPANTTGPSPLLVTRRTTRIRRSRAWILAGVAKSWLRARFYDSTSNTAPIPATVTHTYEAPSK